MPLLRVRHLTEYAYASTVSSSYGEILMLPRDQPGQRVLARRLDITPEPHDQRLRDDYFTNLAAYFAVLVPHTRLRVTVESLVRTAGSGAQGTPSAVGPWEAAVAALRSRPRDIDFLLDSPQVPVLPELGEYAAPSFPPGRDALAAVRELNTRIHRDFTYTPGITHVSTTVEEVLARRAGVCQDLTHVMIGCLRAQGLAARYVSGYILTEPPPGQPRLVGADATHAWVSVLLPGAHGPTDGWLDVDPTNDQLVDDRYVTTAHGRDYTDVPPLKGVIFSQAERHELTVSVDVEPVAETDPDSGAGSAGTAQTGKANAGKAHTTGAPEPAGSTGTDSADQIAGATGARRAARTGERRATGHE